MIPEPIVFPLDLACPKCRIHVYFTDGSQLPKGSIATCPSCSTPLLKPDEVNAQIIEEHRRRTS